MKKRIGVWIRVSTEDQAKGGSPENHEERAKAYADFHGWTVVETYHLEAVSGKSVMQHPEAKRMLNDIKRGHIDGLIFSKLARLARNTRELLDFADIFREHNADLISIEEKIDTTSPAGRFFYTIIASMGQWEREEIAGRVAASVPIRAKLGKSLGGEIPFGYIREKGKEVELHPIEAPVRKLVHELFVEHRRKKVVARILNEKGYRTRKGGLFSDTTIDRFLRDPIVIGQRRVNYTESTGDKKHWKLKPQEEWVIVPAPRIISDEVWEQCQSILRGMTKNHNKVRSRGIHIFSGKVFCHCGTKMYMRSLSPKYVCYSCKNKIEPNILEEVFHTQLSSFVLSDTEIQKKLQEGKFFVEGKRTLLSTLQHEQVKLQERIDKVFDLYYDNRLTKDAFEKQHHPLYEQFQQKGSEIVNLQEEIDNTSYAFLSNDLVLRDAKNLSEKWTTFSQDDKKRIVDVVLTSIIIGIDEIEVNLKSLPTLPSSSSSDSGGGSSNFSPPTKTAYHASTYKTTDTTEQKNPYSFELVQLSNATMSLRILQSSRQRMFMWTRCSTSISE